MKKNNISKIFTPLNALFMALAITFSFSACDNAIYDYEEDCPPEETVKPNPEPQAGTYRISVRTNPGSGGTSNVTDNKNNANFAETEEGIYASIIVEENGTYTLKATESNPEYRFVRWHDDTNNGDLTEGQKVISNIKATESIKYTAIFEKIEPEPEPGYYRISVRTNPGYGGTSSVADDANSENSAGTSEGIYVNIVVKENGTYTLTATESNPDYKFVRWHDDTNDGDLTEGQATISKIKATESIKYTAIFEKIEQPEEPEPEPGYYRISVRTNPGNGGTSSVADDADSENSANTPQGIYESIIVKENGTYTLTATESNPEYRFVRWHDDTNDGNLTEGQMIIPNIKATESTKYTAIFEKIEQPEEPELEPGYYRISVRTNPGNGGTSNVADNANSENKAGTNEGIYVSIVVKENGTYTLTATESNPDYKFVRWHDDTNDGDLTEGKLEISGIKAVESTKYTAIFEKIEQPAEPEPEPEAKYYVKFIFDRNMQFVDAFNSKVKSVDLYVFNQTGAFIKKYHEEDVQMLQDRNYLMDVTDLGAGTYRMIAWCNGQTNNEYFTIPASVSNYSQLAATLNTNSGSPYNYQDKQLTALFHGMSLDENNQMFTYTTETTDQVKTIYLTKDTNDIAITLQHRRLLPFTKDRFKIVMTDNNGAMSYDNSLNSNNETVEYRPNYIQHSTISGTVDGVETTGNYLKADLSTARLMENHNPTITVIDTENNNKVIFSIPLIKWALQLRSSKYRDMPNQEYLDREDTYNLMLWLDSYDPETGEDEGWFGVSIEINEWHVIDDESNID